MTSVGEDLPNVMAHVRDEVIPAYQSIGPAGGFVVAMARGLLDEAAKAMAAGDTVAMIRVYQELKDIKL